MYIKQQQLAETLEISEASLSNYLADKQRPSRKNAQALEAKTGIPAADWLTAPIDELRAKITTWGQQQPS